MGRKKVRMDAAVAAVLGDADRRERRRRMTKTERRQAERDAERERVTLELDPRVVSMIRSIAEAEGCSPAGAVNLLLADAIGRYVDGIVEFHGHRRASRSPRYKWVTLPPGISQLSGGSIQDPHRQQQHLAPVRVT